jgi:hypothetical protein
MVEGMSLIEDHTIKDAPVQLTIVCDAVVIGRYQPKSSALLADSLLLE